MRGQHTMRAVWMAVLLAEALLADLTQVAMARPNCTAASLELLNSASYQPDSLELVFDLGDELNSSLVECFQHEGRDTEHVLELVALAAQEPEEAEARGDKVDDSLPETKCCKTLCKGARVQDQVYISHLVRADTSFAFRYVGGRYMVRHRKCTCSNGYCFRCQTKRCSGLQVHGEESVLEASDTCGSDDLASLYHQSFYSDRRNFSVENCSIDITAVFGTCNRIQSYTEAEVTIYEASENGTCPDSLTDLRKIFTTSIAVTNCNTSYCSSLNTTALGLVKHEVEAEANLSYCVRLDQGGPYCQSSPEACTVVYHQPVKCRWNQSQAILFLPLSEPIFIGCVCGVLLLSLLLLLWTVVKCKKDQHTPHSSPEPDVIKDRTIPRSLTIDEMEHIIRLRQQELVLVYFPDTERFMNLNRQMKDWLLSLSLLNVNDVTDIYDTKYADGPDGILKDPEGWVSNLLSDPERRVILVTSKLAYECLVHIRKGLTPPKFPNYEAHSQVLFSLLRFLDSEMFRGNYRRLICVRYEDLKICDRRYGSESFNIVPGTEYLLPQHLEDIARWIHPVEARPGLWAEHRPQVRQLLDSLREYRHHEDNIFTVSFYDGDNGALLGHELKNGY